MCDDDPLFSRSGRTNPQGKCSATLPPIAVPEQLMNDLLGLVFVKGDTNISEVVRDILVKEMYGAVGMIRLNNKNLSIGTSGKHRENNFGGGE